MFLIYIGFVNCLVLPFTLCYQDDASDGYHYQKAFPQDVMVDVINNFGLALLEAHNEGNNNNIALSPYGATSVLVALGEGLHGHAAHEIQEAARIPLDLSVVRIGLRDVHRHLKSYFIPQEGFLAGLTLSCEKVPLNADYEDILRFYGYDIQSFNNPLYSESFTTTAPSAESNTTTEISTMQTETTATAPTETVTLETRRETAQTEATTTTASTTLTTGSTTTATTESFPETSTLTTSGSASTVTLTTSQLTTETSPPTTQPMDMTSTSTVAGTTSTSMPTTITTTTFVPTTTEIVSETSSSSTSVPTTLTTAADIITMSSTIRDMTSTATSASEQATLTSTSKISTLPSMLSDTKTTALDGGTTMKIDMQFLTDEFMSTIELERTTRDSSKLTTLSLGMPESTSSQGTTSESTTLRDSSDRTTELEKTTTDNSKLATLSLTVSESTRSEGTTVEGTTLTESTAELESTTKLSTVPLSLSQTIRSEVTTVETSTSQSTTSDIPTESDRTTRDNSKLTTLDLPATTRSSTEGTAIETTTSKGTTSESITEADRTTRDNSKLTTIVLSETTKTEGTTVEFATSTAVLSEASTQRNVAEVTTPIFITSQVPEVTQADGQTTTNVVTLSSLSESDTPTSTISSTVLLDEDAYNKQTPPRDTSTTDFSTTQTLQSTITFEPIGVSTVSDVPNTETSTFHDMISTTYDTNNFQASTIFNNLDSTNSTLSRFPDEVTGTAGYSTVNSEGTSTSKSTFEEDSTEDVRTTLVPENYTFSTIIATSITSSVSSSTSEFKTSTFFDDSPTQAFSATKDTDASTITSNDEISTYSEESTTYSVESTSSTDTSEYGYSTENISGTTENDDSTSESISTDSIESNEILDYDSTENSEERFEVDTRMRNAFRVGRENDTIAVTKNRKTRSLVDYIVARHYDNYNINNHRHRSYHPEDHLAFFVYGKVREPNINFMTYDAVLPFAYIPILNAMALSFPLDSKEYYLLLLLPVDEQGIDTLIHDLRRTISLKEIITSLKYSHVNAIIPSFMLKGFVILTPTLQKLGIRSIFEPRQADFSLMTKENDLYVTNVEQAVTVTIRNYVDPESLPQFRSLQEFRPIEFKADHPFLYFVMDSDIHVSLMAGKIVNPLNSRIR